MRQNRRITPEGTRDLLFEESLARREAEGMLSDLFVGRGFSEVMTPGMEFYDVFHADTMAIPEESMYKFGQWRDVLWMGRSLRPHDGAPEPTVPFPEISDSPLVNRALRQAMQRIHDI